MPLFANNTGEINFYSSRSLKKFLKKSGSLVSPLRYVITYAIWVLTIRLLTLTFITYFIISPTSRFQDISDAFGSNEVSLMGLSAFLYVGLLCGLNPMTQTPLSEIITRERIEKNFLPGFIRGAFFAGGVISIFVLCSAYRYLGYFIQLEEAPLELVNVVLRMAALGILAYCEEFIFRHKISQALKNALPNLAAANFCAVFYCGIKLLQFDLGIMQLMTLYLVSIALYYRAQVEGQFAKGAGFWAAILIIFQPLLSLPIFGNDFSGILLLKYQASSQPFTLGFSSQFAEYSTGLIRLLSGGAGGPLASFAFQLLLILDIVRSILKKGR